MEKTELFIKKSGNMKVNKNNTNSNVMGSGKKNNCEDTHIEDFSKYGLKSKKCPPQIK